MELGKPSLTPEDFHSRWQQARLSERASYQQHFSDVCRLVGAPTPIEFDATGENFTFEYGLKKTDGRQGYADVFYRGFFAIEYKGRGKYKDLAEAYRQLQQYRENLDNPPLLIVCDIEHWEIHTNFTGTPVQVTQFRHDDILKPHYRDILRRIFRDPASFHPESNKLQITEAVAGQFKSVVDETLELNHDPERVARFMTKLVFCMFVEDIGLLPKRAYDGILTEIVKMTRMRADYREMFARYVRELFDAMATGGNVQMLDIPYFNGSMFEVGDDDIVPLGRAALNALDQASDRNWSHVEPAVFGTIFERTLDKAKRGQLGAHYTHPDDIRLIVEPVLIEPLKRAWAAAQTEAAAVRERYVNAANVADKLRAEADLSAIRARALAGVRSVTVLDPACGSGNFLYISLRLLLDLEKEIITHPLWVGLPKESIQVAPTQLYGIEINEIAHALASVVVWIGYLQWRQDNGFFETRQPILSKMSENIVHRDAILSYDGAGKPVEPAWPAVDVIVGNPPFLGGKKLRNQLGDMYLTMLFSLYEGRVPHEADLVTYWFERARTELECGNVKRVGLLSTNSIRGGTNREVLKRIKKCGDIFLAWSDRPWILDGAAVRVSVIGFDSGIEQIRLLDGNPVNEIFSDLSGVADIATGAKRLSENADFAFMGDTKGGAFDIPEGIAKSMLIAENESGLSNSDVIRRWANGLDVTRSSRNMWIIDFGMDTPVETAKLYKAPFAYIEQHVFATRQTNRRELYKERWWIHAEPRPAMRDNLAKLSRYIATPTVAKHRVFVWLHPSVLPDHQLIVIARQDDYFFGVLHSRLHEVWSLRMGTWLGKGNDPRYTPTTTFETFPFPFTPGREDFSDPRVQAVSAAAAALHAERDAWLKADDANERTLTNLYNALQVHRGQASSKVRPAAAAFAPRLAALHDALDAAVCAAYGWETAVLADEAALLGRLLALNQARSGESSLTTEATEHTEDAEDF